MVVCFRSGLSYETTLKEEGKNSSSGTRLVSDEFLTRSRLGSRNLEPVSDWGFMPNE